MPPQPPLREKKIHKNRKKKRKFLNYPTKKRKEKTEMYAMMFKSIGAIRFATQSTLQAAKKHMILIYVLPLH